MLDRPSPADPRATRSRKRLRDALFALAFERGWDAVSVQQICARAGVGRSTFYVHFADREDLLLGAFQGEHIVSGAVRSRPLGFVRPLVQHVQEHRALYHVLSGTSCERAVRRRFLQVVTELIETDLASRAAPSPQRTAAVRYLAGAYFETLSFWLEPRNQLSGGEIERMLLQFSAPVIACTR
jgi:AcrR family transcriptional regulator